LAYKQNCIIGGSGNCSDAVNSNGGCYGTEEAVYTGNWADLMGANGGPVHTYAKGTVVSWTVADGKLTHDDINGFASAQVGMGIYVNFEVAGVVGWWLIDVIDETNHKWIHLYNAPEYSNEKPGVRVGGAWKNDDTGIQQALDVITAGETIEICCNQSTGTTMVIAADLATNVANDGTATALLQMKGVDNSDGSDLDATGKYPVLQASVNMTNILNVQSRFWRIGHLDFDGNGKTITDAVTVGDVYNTIYECLCHNIAGGDGFNTTTNNIIFVGCEAWDIAGRGFVSVATGGAFIGCSAHECAGGGMNLTGGNGSSIINCRAYHNTGYGIYLRSYGGVCTGNVSDDNSTYGFYIADSPYMLTVANNSATNNTSEGYYAQTSGVKSFAMFAGNHSYNNSAHSNMCADGAWADLFGGGNITGDPLFRGDETDGDYYPLSGSPLLEAGWPGCAGYETNQDAITLYQSIGVWNRHADYPAAGNTADDDTTDGAAGTLTLPDAGDLQEGVQCGADGTEITGTFVVPAESVVYVDETYGADGTEFTGTYTPVDDVPTAPTLAIAVSGTTVTATITGDAGLTHYLKYKASSAAAWVDGGSRSGDGTITVADLDYDAHYIFVAYTKSANNLYSLPSVGLIVLITTASEASHIISAKNVIALQLDIFGEPIEYKTAGGSQYNINAIPGPELIEVLDDEYGQARVRTREFSISLASGEGYSDPAYSDQITYNGLAWKVTNVGSKIDGMATLSTINKTDLEKHHQQLKHRLED